MLDWAEAVVPRKQWERTPIFLFGTAGLRKLPKEAQHTLLIDLRDALSQCSFRSARKLSVRIPRHVLQHPGAECKIVVDDSPVFICGS